MASLELLNFSAFDLDCADYDQINMELETVDWENFVNEVFVEDFPQKFQFKVHSILQKHCSLKYSNKKIYNYHFKQRRILTRKIIKLNRLLCMAKFSGFSCNAIGRINNKINKLKSQLRSS